MSLLKQDIIRKERVDEEVRQMEFDLEDNHSGKYKVEAIWDSMIYARKSELGYLLGLYYLIVWERYLEEKNIWEPVSTVYYLRKLINSFHKDHPNKLTATFPTINITLSLARPTISFTKSTK